VSVLSELHCQRLRRLPCVACFVIRGVRHPMEELHHVEKDRGPFSDFLQLPLCWEMHQGPTGIHGRHRLGFERLHGVTQLQLLGVTNSLLLADRSLLVGG
jgi:hypothetical protein